MDARANDGASLEADLAISLHLSTQTAVVGDEITITIEVYNHGPRTPEGVIVHYLLPDGLAFLGVAFSDPSDSYNPATGAWQVGAIPRDMLMPVPTMRLDMTARVMETGTTEHIAEVIQSSRPDPDSEPGNANPAEDDYTRALLTTEVAGMLDLRLATSDGGIQAVPGEQLTYALDYANAGLAASGVVLTERIPEHTTFDAENSTPGWVAVGGRQYDLALGTLEAGTSGTVAFTVIVDAAVSETATEITNTASITDDGSQGADATPADNQSIIHTPLAHPAEADLSLALSVSNTTPEVGEELDIFVELVNAGPAQATGVTVAVSLPQGVRLIMYDGNYEATTGLWSLDPMSAGTQAALHLTIEILTPEPLYIVAAVNTSDQEDPDSIPGEKGANEDDEAEIAVLGNLGETMLTGPVGGSQVHSSSVDLLWEAVPGALHYDVEVALEGEGFATPVVTSMVETTSAHIEGLVKNTNYAWRVRAVAGEVAGVWSQVGVFTVADNAVGTETQAMLGEAYLLSATYPNPFNPETSFRLAVAQAQAVTIAVYDVLGRRVDVLFEGEVAANTSRVFRWEASSHPSGLYFMRVVGEQFVQTRRVTLLK